MSGMRQYVNRNHKMRAWKRRNRSKVRTQKKRARERKRKRPADWNDIQKREAELRRGFRKPRDRLYCLRVAWRRVTSWLRYCAVPLPVVVLPDPAFCVTWLVYALIDPRTRLIRYIGQSTTGLGRPRSHRKPSSVASKYPVARWALKLENLGMTYEIHPLQFVCVGDKVELDAQERWWIAYGRASGWPLLNLTSGGEGTPGRHVSDEERARMSERSKAKWLDAEYRSKCAPSESRRAALSDRAKARWMDPEYREKMSAMLRGAKRVRGDDHPMKRPEVRERHAEALARRAQGLEPMPSKH